MSTFPMDLCNRTICISFYVTLCYSTVWCGHWTYSNSTQVRFVIRIKCRSYSFVYLDLQNWNDCNGVLIVPIYTIPSDRTNKVIFTHLICIGSNAWPDVLWMKWKSQLTDNCMSSRTIQINKFFILWHFKVAGDKSSSFRYFFSCFCFI